MFQEHDLGHLKAFACVGKHFVERVKEQFDRIPKCVVHLSHGGSDK